MTALKFKYYPIGSANVIQPSLNFNVTFVTYKVKKDVVELVKKDVRAYGLLVFRDQGAYRQ